MPAVISSPRAEAIVALVRSCLRVAEGPSNRLATDTTARIEKAFALLPDPAAELFLSGQRDLTVLIAEDPGLPLGMKTTSAGPSHERHYLVTIFEELQELPEDLFIASFLRQLAHVVREMPPDEEWPSQRSARAHFREMLENHADALVWCWGLKDQNLRFLEATYPPHILEDIIPRIEEALHSEQFPMQH